MSPDASATGGTVASAGGESLDDLHTLGSRALDEVAAAADLSALDEVRNRYLGRGDGLISARLRGIGQIPDEAARRQVGKTLGELRSRVDDAIEERRRDLERAAETGRMGAEAIDLTRPAPPLRRGHLHPVTRCAREIRRIFGHLGYTAAGGPEVEYDRYNFELVNMPEGHPARDTQGTFFVDGARVLRTQTSPVQVRAMVSRGAPLRVIVPGTTFRPDHDATHFPMFHQCEGLCVDEGVSLGDLKGTLLHFARSMFGPDRSIRLRPHHFPFTEPSLEVDVSCMTCGGAGCRTCRQSGWIEILGCGMVHPQVLRNGGVDPERFSGFAFGMGIERIAQLRYGIDDGRILYENDVRTLRPVPPGAP